MSLFTVGNYVEAALWIVLAGVVWLRCNGWACRGAMVTSLVAFGISDIVEVQTGAWWRPWWLLGWKVICVAAMFTMLISARKSRAEMASHTKPLSQSGPESPETSPTDEPH